MAARDPGLPSERTALAWQRTGVSASLGSAVGLLAAAHDRHAWLVGVVAALCVAGVLAAGLVTQRRTPVHGTPAGLAESAWRRLVLTAAATLLLGTTGVLLAVVSLVGG